MSVNICVCLTICASVLIPGCNCVCSPSIVPLCVPASRSTCLQLRLQCRHARQNICQDARTPGCMPDNCGITNSTSQTHPYFHFYWTFCCIRYFQFYTPATHAMSKYTTWNSIQINPLLLIYTQYITSHLYNVHYKNVVYIMHPQNIH